MWLYWLIFIFSTILALTHLRPVHQLELHPHWLNVWGLTFVLLVFAIGLRHEVGGDWFNYVEHVNTASTQSLLEAVAQGDPAYSLINWVAAKSGMGVYFTNSICAVFFTWGLLVFCRAQPRPWLALVVAVPYLITVVAMGYTRQSVAIGLAMIGLVSLGRGRILYFIIWIALAATFHKSAVILIPLAILAGSNNRLLTLFWVTFSGGILFLLMLQESVENLKSGYLDAGYQSSGAVVRIAMNAFPAAIFLLLRRRFQLSRNQCIFWTWISLGAISFLILLKISPSSTAVDRVALYWIPLQLFVWSRLPNAIGTRTGYNPIWVFVVVVYSATILFIWLFFADNAFAWLPYKFLPVTWL
jgi:hypothetical protein